MYLRRNIKWVFFFSKRSYLFCQNGVREGKGLDIGAEPPDITLCRVPPSTPLGIIPKQLSLQDQDKPDCEQLSVHHLTIFNVNFVFSSSLGLLSDEPVLQQKTPLDTLCLFLTEKLAYGMLKRTSCRLFNILFLSSWTNILTL